MKVLREKLEKAIALRYDPQQESAPRIVAQGKGEAAKRIKEIGKEHAIPVYEDPELAQTLSDIDLGREVPIELYQVIAEVLVFVKGLKDKAQGVLKR